MADLSVPISAGTGVFDPSIANGTCYFAANKPHTSNFLPCGNDAGGEATPCCFAGDICLSSNACYDPETLTYIAGCTDLTYEAWSCPFKSDIYASEEWVAVTWSCDDKTRDEKLDEDEGLGIVAVAAVGSNSVVQGQTGMLGSSVPNCDEEEDDDDATAGTSDGFLHQHGWNVSSTAQAPEEYVVERKKENQGFNPDETVGWVSCPIQDGSGNPGSFHGTCDSCLGSANDGSLDILFQDTMELSRFATLPQEMGGVVIWEPGFEPSGGGIRPPATTSMTTCASTMTGTGVAASPTGDPNTNPTTTDPDDLVATKQPGDGRTNIIVAATSVCVIILLMGALAWLLWKRHQRHEQERHAIRAQHMALARGPSPPRIPIGQQNGRGGNGSGSSTPTTPNFLAPIRSIRDTVRGSTSLRRVSSHLGSGKSRLNDQQRLSTATTETNANSMYMGPSTAMPVSAAAGVETALAPSRSTQPLAGQVQLRPEKSIASERSADTSLSAAPLLKTRSRSNTFGRSSLPPSNTGSEPLQGSPRSTKTTKNDHSADDGDIMGRRGLENLSRQSSMTQDTIQEARRLQVHIVNRTMARVLVLGETDAEKKEEN